MPVHFYDDLVKGKIVAISLIYTTCKYACPLETARLAQVAKLLGDRMGRDVFFYSITIDPEHDTPQVLKEYAEKFHAGKGWTFLTGKAEDIEQISKKLGLYSEPNPRNPDGHTPMLLIGNEATGQWMRNSATDNAEVPRAHDRRLAEQLADGEEVGAVVRDVPTLAYDAGEVTFRNHCAACHTIGRGDHRRSGSPRRHRGARSRLAVAFHHRAGQGARQRRPDRREPAAKYQQVLMPNLGLGSDDADVLIDYMETQSRAGPDRAASTDDDGVAGCRRELSPIVDPYLRIQRALSADRLRRCASARG